MLSLSDEKHLEIHLLGDKVEKFELVEYQKYKFLLNRRVDYIKLIIALSKWLEESEGKTEEEYHAWVDAKMQQNYEGFSDQLSELKPSDDKRQLELDESSNIFDKAQNFNNQLIEEGENNQLKSMEIDNQSNILDHSDIHSDNKHDSGNKAGPIESKFDGKLQKDDKLSKGQFIFQKFQNTDFHWLSCQKLKIQFHQGKQLKELDLAEKDCNYSDKSQIKFELEKMRQYSQGIGRMCILKPSLTEDQILELVRQSFQNDTKIQLKAIEENLKRADMQKYKASLQKKEKDESKQNKCQNRDCTNRTTLKCTKCVENNLADAWYCSQSCFKACWDTHKLVHFQARSNPFKKQEKNTRANKNVNELIEALTVEETSRENMFRNKEEYCLEEFCKDRNIAKYWKNRYEGFYRYIMNYLMDGYILIRNKRKFTYFTAKEDGFFTYFQYLGEINDKNQPGGLGKIVIDGITFFGEFKIEDTDKLMRFSRDKINGFGHISQQEGNYYGHIKNGYAYGRGEYIKYINIEMLPPFLSIDFKAGDEYDMQKAHNHMLIPQEDKIVADDWNEKKRLW